MLLIYDEPDNPDIYCGSGLDEFTQSDALRLPERESSDELNELRIGLVVDGVTSHNLDDERCPAHGGDQSNRTCHRHIQNNYHDKGRKTVNEESSRAFGSFAVQPTPPPVASTATLAWSPVIDPTVAGYKVHVGTASGLYSRDITVGNLTSYTVDSLSLGNTYFFVVTAYSSDGGESLASNEVSKSIY